MNSKIIDGKKRAEEILDSLKIKVKDLKLKHNKEVNIAIVQIGDNKASSLYIKNKISAARLIGMHANLHKLKKDSKEEDLKSLIGFLNNSKDVDGIIIQLPLPKNFDVSSIFALIDPNKDIDGLTPYNFGKLFLGSADCFVPCTSLGCVDLLEKYLGNLEGLNISIIGRSNIVGRPLLAYLLNKNASVTICHSYSKNLHEVTSKSDVVIVAAGKAKYFTNEYFKLGAVILDVGINHVNGRLYGDVDFDNVIHKAKYISKVPGGVGPMTVVSLLSNALKAALFQIKNKSE